MENQKTTESGTNIFWGVLKLIVAIIMIVFALQGLMM
jgi:hypothetical protein